ncbi:hypothetical protein Tco_1435477 [Tanacetum coccineum]
MGTMAATSFSRLISGVTPLVGTFSCGGTSGETVSWPWFSVPSLSVIQRAQLDDRHVSHLAFDGSDRMVGETIVGLPIPSSPF